MNSGLAGLIIDMQSDFLKDIEKNEKERMIQAQIRLIRKLSIYGAPIIVLEYEKKGKTISEITNEIRFFELKKPLIKVLNDGFYHTGLHQLLKRQHVQNIILRGINASACVQATAETAIIKKYGVYTARELIAEKEKYSDKEMDKKIETWYKAHNAPYFKTEEQLWGFLTKE